MSFGEYRAPLAAVRFRVQMPIS